MESLEHPGKFEEEKGIEELALKYQKGDEIPVAFEKKEGSVGIFHLILEGHKIGVFTITDPEKDFGRKSDIKVKQIGYVRINDLFKNKGLGKQFYIKLNEHMHSIDGSFLESGDMTSVFADRVWHSLFKDGLVIKSGTNPFGEDTFRFTEKLDDTI